MNLLNMQKQKTSNLIFKKNFYEAGFKKVGEFISKKFDKNENIIEIEKIL